MRSVMEIHNFDVAKFAEIIDSCKGDVLLVTPEGDSLNLKSKLCQLIGLTSLIEGGKVAQASIKCQYAEDEAMLFRFNLWGKTE